MKIIPDRTKPINEWKVEMTKQEAEAVVVHIKAHLEWFERVAVPFYTKMFPSQ